MSSNVPAAGPDLLSYVYAVGRTVPELEDAASRLTGHGGAAMRTVGADGLTAVVCSVPAVEFDEAGLKAQLEDLSRLEAIARSHHAVVGALVERTAVLPLRLATVYRDDARVAGMLQESRDAFAATLERLEGHVEWGVKVYAEPVEPRTETAAPASAPTNGSEAESRVSPGRAYLQRRRAQRSSRKDAYRAAGEAANRVAAVAASFAAGRVAHRPQQGALAEGAGENIANDAYLVPLERSEEFRAAVAEEGRTLSGARVDVTGPWAPYSFATPVDGGGAGDGHVR
ncbi:GvpL/GvpF family gas vesicle protein [Streptomyces sp. NPDC048639]|uniref:GvpL/GvpF family gas vesicle protein n=1 Tax=Streptomyces sp. NPDC048639 TaxID=3365581 RepID=UPI0037106E60